MLRFFGAIGCFSVVLGCGVTTGTPVDAATTATMAALRVSAPNGSVKVEVKGQVTRPSGLLVAPVAKAPVELVQDDKVIVTASSDFDGQFHLVGTIRSGSFFVRLAQAPNIAQRAKADWRSWRVRDIELLAPRETAAE
ncbi:MAG TPA: hypothetical protein VIV60_08740 [Polyangiaceae bacterium]